MSDDRSHQKWTFRNFAFPQQHRIQNKYQSCMKKQQSVLLVSDSLPSHSIFTLVLDPLYYDLTSDGKTQ